MDASPGALLSPPPRPPVEGRAKTKSSGPACTPCILCTPPARDVVSPPYALGRETVEDPRALIVESWCSPTLVSPAWRPVSVMQLAKQQAAEPSDISNPFLDDKEWDMEALVLETIAGQLEDEEEEEDDDTPPVKEESDDVQYCEDAEPEQGPFDGWALASRGATQPRDTSCAVACTPSVGTSSALVEHSSDQKTDGSSRLPTLGTAQERKKQHFEMASKHGHASFACHCRIARARGATSCLDRFSKEQFRRWHNEAYGVTADGSVAVHLDPATSILNKMWALKEPRFPKNEGQCDTYGRKWKITEWKLDSHEVCMLLHTMITHTHTQVAHCTQNSCTSGLPQWMDACCWRHREDAPHRPLMRVPWSRAWRR